MSGAPRRSGPDALEALLPMLLMADGAAVSAARGGSMGEPFASATDVQVNLGSREGLRPGEVVAVAGAGSLVIHRLVHVGSGDRAGYVITKGDALRLPDPPVSVDAVVGRVSAIRVRGVWEAVASSPRARAGFAAGIVRVVFERNVHAAVLLTRLLRSGASLVARVRARLGVTT